MLKKDWVRVAAAALLIATFGCGDDDPMRPPPPPPPPPPSAPEARFSASTTEADAPASISFRDESNGSVSAWSWNFGDGSAPSSEPNPSHQFTVAGKYIVKLTVSGSGGTSSIQKAITINKIVHVHTTTLKLGPFWPRHTEGDCDFDGHGPTVDANVRLGVSSDGQRILAYTYMKATETQADWTTAQSDFAGLPIPLPSKPIGWRVKSLLGQTTSSVAFSDAGHGYHNIAGNTGIASFSIKGDTDGDDVCNKTLDDTHMYVWVIDYSYRVGP